jgi:glycosyltransferase involved in cell wall biosynthesis
LQDEQSRIIFDAFGQGLMIIGSNTEGLKQTCKHEINSILIERGNAAALAEAIEYAVDNTNRVVEMGLEGLLFAQTKTHQQMHQDRYSFLSSVLNQDESYAILS